VDCGGHHPPQEASIRTFDPIEIAATAQRMSPSKLANGALFDSMPARRTTVKRALMILGLIALSGIGIAEAADPAAGKVKAAACAGCHGANGEGVAQNPPLAGMNEAQFIQAMDDYKSGKRSNAMMKVLATPLSKQDIENVAAFYASLKK
jgi:cytochrome c553